MHLDVHFVDSFTQQPGAGNPAAVVLLEQWPSAEAMQTLARDLDLSETAFVCRNEQGLWAIRWFSPLTEIDFCGHATLASAAILFAQHPQLPVLTFWAAAVGEIEVQHDAAGRIEMAFPNQAPSPLDTPPSELLQGLSIEGCSYLQNSQAYFVIYPSAQQVREVQPQLEYLKCLAPRDVVVTAPGDNGYDFVCRYFWPANGGAEDPVTGSIYAGLAPYWSQQLAQERLYALQASARTGEIWCRVESHKVFVAGHCIRHASRRIEL